MSLDSVLSKVRKLIAVAEDPNTDPKVATSYREMADALMLKHAVDETQAEASRPAEQRTRPIIITVEIGGDSDIIGYFGSLCDMVARHCRCRALLYTAWRDGVWVAKVYGFESDARYFELLYTTIRLHMLGVLIPRIDRNSSLSENCYRLHNAGYNWLEIARMYGWSKVGLREGTEMWRDSEGNDKTKFHVGGIYKRAYYQATKERGEQPTKISAGGTATYRKSAAYGYTSRLTQRLRQVESNRQAGTEILLASRVDDLDALFRDDNPEMFLEVPEEDPKNSKPARRRKAPTFSFNEQAYGVGVRHANTADLSTGVGSKTPDALR
jgi:hypothetical protein